MEPVLKVPLWLELSGLPATMNKAAHSPGAWSVFCKLVALDCQQNPSAPAEVAISVQNLAVACGISSKAARKILAVLRKKKWIACFLPDNDEEEGLFQVKVPLATPTSAASVQQAHPNLFPESGGPLRYESAPQTEAPEGAGEDSALHDVIDLYFNTISMKMNSFILDELRLIRQRFESPVIRRIFYRARNHGITSMGWVLRELHRETARKLKREVAKGDGEDSSDS